MSPPEAYNVNAANFLKEIYLIVFIFFFFQIRQGNDVLKFKEAKKNIYLISRRVG